MSFARLRFHAHFQSHNQGSEVSLRVLQGHLLHTVTFLVSIMLVFDMPVILMKISRVSSLFS